MNWCRPYCHSVAIGLAVFFSSALIAGLFWTLLPEHHKTNQSSDYFDFYKPTARNIYEGKGIVYSNGMPATAWPPGFPIVLAGVMAVSKWSTISYDTCLLFFNVVGIALSSVLLFCIARLYWSIRFALISAFAWMTYPFALWLIKQPNSEIPFLVLFYLALFVFTRALSKRQYSLIPYFCSGFLIGLSMLVRPIAIGAVFVLAATFWLTARSVSKTARRFVVIAMLLGNITAILPWELWVYLNTRQVTTRVNQGKAGIYYGLTYAVDHRGYRLHDNVPQDIATLMRRFVSREDEMGSFSSIANVLLEETLAQPWTATKLVFLKVIRSWYGTDSGNLERIILLVQLPYLLVLIWCGFKAWNTQGISRDLSMTICLMVFYFWWMSIMVVSTLRYMVPAMGLLFLLLPAGLQAWQVISAKTLATQFAARFKS
jgi:hypothetical protein